VSKQYKTRLTEREPRRFKGYRCPCCNSKTLNGRGKFELCPVCFWEDDGLDDRDRTGKWPTLKQAKLNYQKFGACDQRWIHNVRPPKASER
jgi:hypothetical protein